MPDQTPSQFTEVAEVYDSLMSVVPYSWWVEYVRGLWARHGVEPHRVLDLACGTGNVTLELLKRGYSVDGVDASEGMLRIARRKLGERARLWRQDARELDLPPPPYDACVCLFDSLNYLLEPGDLRRCFSGIRRHLRPGGILVFDMNAIRALESGMFDQRGTGRDASLEFEWHSAWDPASRLCTIRMEFRVHEAEGTRVFHETHLQRGYTRGEITGALEEAGLRLVGFYEAFSTREPTAKTDRYHVVAMT